VETSLVFVDSAFKHRISEADILWAFETARFDGLIEGYDNKYLLLGFDSKGNLLEVMYNEIGENVKKVFHAMPCRSAFRFLLNFL
jgi:hypothetical protein